MLHYQLISAKECFLMNSSFSHLLALLLDEQNQPEVDEGVGVFPVHWHVSLGYTPEGPAPATGEERKHSWLSGE